jgi:ankyrin repeat protein
VKVDAAGKCGRTALRAAAWSGHADIVCKLLAANADVNRADVDEGRTALMAAAYMGHGEIAQQLLLAAGDRVDVNAIDVHGCSALHMAAVCPSSSSSSSSSSHLVRVLIDGK